MRCKHDTDMLSAGTVHQEQECGIKFSEISGSLPAKCSTIHQLASNFVCQPFGAFLLTRLLRVIQVNIRIPAVVPKQ